VKYVSENPDAQQQLADAEAKAQQGLDDAKQQAQV
jgi:F0F1-type ATP synthase membrane subunit b/b'